MSTLPSVGIVGYGRIGRAIKHYLEKEGYSAVAYDVAAQPGCQQKPSTYDELVQSHQAIVAATPYKENIEIAGACYRNNVAYFDLTEDVHVSTAIQRMTSLDGSKKSWMMPQCGLAPGAVSILANHLTTDFEILHSVELRVGALPKYANNRLQYYLTWSSDGLINEYINNCKAVIDANPVMVKALEGYERINILGNEYEAFNTSGGLGTLGESLLRSYKKVQHVNYKTIRYVGHHDLICFLLEDLNFRNNKQQLVDLFNRELPQTTEDVIVIFIKVVGIKHNKLTTEVYCNKIFGDSDFTAIQRSTASGVCSALHWWATNKPDTSGLITNESIPFNSLKTNPFWVY